jgi:hypothetical protein
MDLRAGSPATERRTGSRSLRGPILAGPASPCANDNDRLRFPPASPARNSKAEKKESTGRRLNRPCQPCAKPSSNSSLDHHRNDARTAENGFAASGGISKSAKVVLGPEKVAALVKGDVERPSDFDGVVYISVDDSGWRLKLGKELEAAGFTIDWAKVA